MKKKLLFVICALAVLLIAAVSASAATVTIDSTAFPDAVFRVYVSDNLDTNHDGSLSDDEITEVRSIDVHRSGITSLEGLELFTELTDLNCSNNNLTALDISKNTELTRLVVNNNSLTSLILSANSELHSLQCDQNCLTELDISGTQILISPETLWGTIGNQMNDAPIIVSMTPEQKNIFDNVYAFMDGNANVIVNEVDGRFPDAFFRAYVYDHFDTNFNGILSDSEIGAVTRIDVKNMSGITSLKGVELFTELTYLDCGHCNLTMLDVSRNTKLTYLDCAANQLTSLNVEKNVLLYHLDCTDNALSSLDVSKNTQLWYLACGWNQLISLDISDLPLLTYLNVNNNSLTSLSLSGNPKLHSFQCYSNFLTEVDISCTQIFVSPDTYMGNFGIQKNQGTIIVTMTAAQSSKYKARYESSYNNVRVTVRLADERFSDPIFRTYVYNNFDTNGDGTLSDSEIAAVTTINASGWGIASLKGVELFTNLDILLCSENHLTSLDISDLSKLTKLSVYDNGLTSLNLSGNPQLHSLFCDDNCLTELDISGTQVFMSAEQWGELGDQKDSNTITVTMRKAQESVYLAEYAHRSANTGVYVTVKTGNALHAPADLTEIGEEAFANTAFTEVYLPDGVMTIGAKAFKNCGKLEYIEIPGTVTSIADSAFDGCGSFVIAGEAGSTAETFATAHDLVFININSLY